MSKDNLELWNSVGKTNPDNTKKVTFGRGFTAIDPYSQIHEATSVFGAAGDGWGWSVQQVVPLPEIKEIGVLVRLWYGSKDNYIEQFGQNGLFTDNANSKKDGDALKKATTDGLTKCLSYLGFNADVFMGLFDDNKYVAQMKAEFEQISPEPIRQNYVDRAVEVYREELTEDAPEPNYDRMKQVNESLTNDERIAVSNAFGSEKCPDSNKLFRTVIKECLNHHPSDDEIGEEK